MKNFLQVNRALRAKKNFNFNFKHLFVLLAVLITCINTAWGAETLITTTYGTTSHGYLDVANTTSNGTITASTTTVVTFGANYLKGLSSPTWYSCRADKPDQDGTGGVTVTNTGFLPNKGSSGSSFTQAYGCLKVNSSKPAEFWVTGTTGVAIIGKGNSADKKITLSIKEVAADGTTLSSVGTDLEQVATAAIMTHASTLNAAKYYKIIVSSNATDNNYFYQIRFSQPSKPSTSADGEGGVSEIANFMGWKELNTETTYWRDGIKFFQYSSGGIGADSYENFTTAYDYGYNYNLTAGSAWGSYTMSGLATYGAFGIGVSVTEPSLVEIILDNNKKDDTSLSKLSIKKDNVAYKTGYTTSTYCTGTDIKTSKATIACVESGKGRYKVSISVTASDLSESNPYIIKMHQDNWNQPTCFVFESVTVTPTTTCSSAYSFHYGPNGGSWETPICFTQVGETHEWNIENFTIPSHANGEFWVGYAGATNGQSVTKRWTDGLSDTGSGIMNGAMVLLPTNGSIVGQASGATGTLSIWDNSSSKNQYVGFKPDGYAIMYGGNNYAFSETATSNVWETDLLTLPDVSTTYQVGIKTSSSYTTCSHSKSAEALSAPGNTMLKDGKKYIYLNAGVWRTNAEGRPDDVNEKMAVWDATNVSGEWGNGGNFLTYNKATGLYEGYVSSSTTKIVLTRILNSRESLGNSWGDNVNKQTDDITLTAVNNEFTITGWGDSRSPYTAAAHSHPATGDNGKFRMYDNSNDANWYVHWIPYYKLSYDGNGGTGSVAAQYRNSELSTSPLIVAANGFSREGWTFTGWNTEKHGKGTAYDPDDNIDITGDVTLYAQWERDIYFKVGAGWGADNAWYAIYCFDNSDDSKYTWVALTTLADCETDVYKGSLPGNSFDKIIVCRMNKASKTLSFDNKWNQTGNLEYPTTNFQFTPTSLSRDECTGTWGTYSVPTFTISYNAGTGGSGSRGNDSKSCNVAFTLPSSAVFTRTGYTQTGWALTENGSQSHALGGSYTTNADQTFYPVWTAKSCDITFDKNDGSGGSDGTSATYDATMTSITPPTRAGYDFGGYYDAETDDNGSGTKYYNANGTSANTWDKNTTSTTTLYAKWTAHTYTVNLDHQGGTNATNSVTATYNTTLTSAALFDTPTRDAYTFNGYYTQQGGKGDRLITQTRKWHSSAKTGYLGESRLWVYTGEDPLTLYARWDQNVKLDANGGSADGSVTLVWNRNSRSGDVSAPTYDGHTVDLGYFAEATCENKVLNASGSLQTSVTVSAVPYTDASHKWVKEGATTLYAHWKCNTPTISFSNDATNTVTITIPSGTTVYYTTDGSTPTGSSTEYTEPFTIDATKTIKAIAIQSGCTNSGVQSQTCTYTAPTYYNVSHSLTNVTKSSGSAGANAATESVEYTAVFAAAENYILPATITVTIGGESATAGSDYTWSQRTGTVTIPGSNVTGNIAISISGVATEDNYWNEFVWKKSENYGGDGKCMDIYDANTLSTIVSGVITAAQSTATIVGGKDLTMDRPTSVGTDFVLTFDVGPADYYISSLCTYGKIEESAGAYYSWDGGEHWTKIAEYSSEQTKTFDAPDATYPTSFIIKYTCTSTSAGGIYWRNAQVGLAPIPACSDPGLGFASASKSVTLCDDAPTNALTNTHGVTVSYTSSNTSVATVASDGAITLKGAGETTITASSSIETVSAVNYCADEATYTITVAPSTAAGLSYSSTSVEKDYGASNFTNTLTNSNSLTGVTYESSVTTVATVDEETGEVTIVGPGTTTITASSEQQKVSSTCYAAGEASYTLTVYPVYTVSYNAMGGTCSPTTENTTTVLGKVTLPSATHASYTTYEWVISNGSSVGDADEEYTPTADITLYAKWQGSCAGGGGSDPVLSIGASEATTSSYLGTYSTEGITISSDQSWKGNDDKYGPVIALEASSSRYDNTYLEVLASNYNISKVSFLLTGNGSDKSLQPVVFGWASTASSTADTYCMLDAQTVSNKGYANAEWFTYDFSASEVKRVRIYRASKNVSSTSPSYTGSSTAIGNATTIWIYGIKVWLDDGSSSGCKTVTYHGNNATSGYVNDPEQYAAGSSVSAKYNSAISGFERTGYEFVEWNTAANGSGDAYKPFAQITSSIDDDIDLYAQWRIVIDANNTDFAGKDDPTQYRDVKVTKGATLTLTQNTAVRDIIVETGSTLNVSTNSGSPITLSTRSLSLVGGWGTVGEETKYDMPRVYIDPASKITKTTETINFDIAVDNRNFYPIAVPFPVTVSDVDYVNATLAYYSNYGTSGQYVIKTYDGQKRANADMSNCWRVMRDGEKHYLTSPEEDSEVMVPGQGYILRALPASGYGDYAVIRFPMKNVDDEWTNGGEKGSITVKVEEEDVTTTKNAVSVVAYTNNIGGDTKKSNKGWNILGVPYMSCFVSSEMDSDPSDAYLKGLLNITTGEYEKDNDNIYVTVPVHDFSEYIQTPIDEAVLKPGWCFFVQMDKDATLTFDKAGERASAPFRATTYEHMPTVKTGIILSSETASDKTTFLISDKYSAAEYEINADLEKMFGENSYTLATYSLSNETRLAYNAMSRADAANVIPIGYRAPAEGEYTFAINPRYAESGDFERIDLIDYETGFVTNLLQSSYTFTSDRTQSDSRFALNVVPQKETPTDVEPVTGDGLPVTGARKVIIDDKLYIILNGKMYDAKGVMVK